MNKQLAWRICLCALGGLGGYPDLARASRELGYRSLLRNKVLLRVDNLLNVDTTDCLPSDWNILVANEQKKVKAIDLTITRLVDKYGSPRIVPFKSYNHLPDQGDDIDLFSPDSSLRYDMMKDPSYRLLDYSSIKSRLGNKYMFKDSATGVEVEIHERFFGIIGEYKVYPGRLNRQPFRTTQPARLSKKLQMDPLIIFSLLIQRIYIKGFLRISDVLFYQKILAARREFFFDELMVLDSSIGRGFNFFCNSCDSLLRKDNHLPGLVFIQECFVLRNGTLLSLLLWRSIELLKKETQWREAFLSILAIPLVFIKRWRYLKSL